ncbi:SCO3242 family prenyltransferase [Streptomyces sp. NPDC093060]|uniref:SCO3242 family prenyltransferase n=1 Tax=Streptomyces sp. NPDC093060 TaxID=3366019 RepID=UPI00380E297B
MMRVSGLGRAAVTAVTVAALGRAVVSTVTAARPARPAGSAAAASRPAAWAASSPRAPRPRGPLTDLARAAREAARAAGSAFRAARGEAAGESGVSGAGASAAAPDRAGVDASAAAAAPRRSRPYDTGYRPRSVALRQHGRDVAELVRAPAALTVPGDVLAGALAVGRPAAGRTLLLAASSVSLYWAGMALNDWADREEDATERPERPVPSGRIGAGTALGIAAALTAAGLGLGALAGGRQVLLRRTLPLAAAVWAYDLGLKRTPLGPLAMAAARFLDVLHGTGPAPAAPALRAATTVGLHTWAVTRLSRHEVDGEAGHEPLVSLAVTTATVLGASGAAGAVLGSRGAAGAVLGSRGAAGAVLGSRGAAGAVLRRLAAHRVLPDGPAGLTTLRQGPLPVADIVTGTTLLARLPSLRALSAPETSVPLLASAAYAATCARSQWAALRTPQDPARVRAAVGAGIHALLPLQAALVARAGAPRLAVVLAAGLPQAVRLARKVSPT